MVSRPLVVAIVVGLDRVDELAVVALGEDTRDFVLEVETLAEDDWGHGLREANKAKDAPHGSEAAERQTASAGARPVVDVRFLHSASDYRPSDGSVAVGVISSSARSEWARRTCDGRLDLVEQLVVGQGAPARSMREAVTGDWAGWTTRPDRGPGRGSHGTR